MLHEGDSGGPLVCRYGDQDVLVGVASELVTYHEIIEEDENVRDVRGNPWILRQEGRPGRMSYMRLSLPDFKEFIRVEMQRTNDDFNEIFIPRNQGNQRNPGNQPGQGNQRNPRNQKNERQGINRNHRNHGNKGSQRNQDNQGNWRNPRNQRHGKLNKW